MRVLFLYSELSEYTLACFRELVLVNQDVQLIVVHFPINKEAPFHFDFSIGQFYSLNEFRSYDDLVELAERITPHLIVCSGWMHDWYVSLSKKFYSRAITVMTLDNHWFGTLRQWAMVAAARVFQKIKFHYAWVPGSPQVEYARRLGFPDANILKNFYCCNTEQFLAIGEKVRTAKEQRFPRVLLCVARYIPQKGYEQLWSSFIEWNEKQTDPWQLWCAGTGEGFTNRIQHPSIHHLGFVQKEEWEQIIAKTGFFVLLSQFEPWGVAIHEFAAAGYPIIVSKKVGAAEKFVSRQNGWIVDQNSKSSIQHAFDEMGKLQQAEYNKMANASRNLAATLRPADWVNTLLSI